MEYSFTFLEKDFNFLNSFLFSVPGVEQAAFLFCGLSQSERETRFLVTDIIPIQSEELIWQKKDSLGIPSSSLMRAMKKADSSGKCFIFVHSHPEKYDKYSRIDDREECEIFNAAYNRIGQGVHASLLFYGHGQVIGRVWHSNLTTTKVSRVRVLGVNKYRIIDSRIDHEVDVSLFDRQIIAFGKPIQKLVKHLHIGVVGCGGTGSAIIEQLIRLGVRKLSLFDNDTFDITNINRVHGSTVADEGIPKVEIMQRAADSIGLGTQIELINANIGRSHAASQKLKDCDLIFGCTDDNYGRFILNLIAFYYYIPVIDMAVSIDSTGTAELHSITGRVTKLLPQTSCLLCRGRISLELMRTEVMSKEEALKLAKEGYAPALQDRAPAVVCYTTGIASLAINELIHLLTGYMGTDRTTTEILILYDGLEILKSNIPPKPNCFCCSNTIIKGIGDTPDFLGMTWPQEG